MSDDVNPPEPPIEPITIEWEARRGSAGSGAFPFHLRLELVAAYVEPTDAEIREAILRAVLEAIGMDLEPDRYELIPLENPGSDEWHRAVPASSAGGASTCTVCGDVVLRDPSYATDDPNRWFHQDPE